MCSSVLFTKYSSTPLCTNGQDEPPNPNPNSRSSSYCCCKWECDELAAAAAACTHVSHTSEGSTAVSNHAAAQRTAVPGVHIIKEEALPCLPADRVSLRKLMYCCMYSSTQNTTKNFANSGGGKTILLLCVL